MEPHLQSLAQTAASPGHSEHETGLAMDLGIYTDAGISRNFIGQEKYRWICENAPQYGFILRYEQDKTQLTGYHYEPWHFRFVGVPHAGVMKKLNYCLEEYILYLKQFPFEKQHLFIEDDAQRRYEIYYVAADKDPVNLPVPLDAEYTISGNNVDGFIVTVLLA